MPEAGVVSVLAIDPDPVVLSFIRRIATSSGYGFFGAKQGEDGLKKLRSQPPDAIILRALLPDTTARAFLTLLRDEQISAPVLLTARRGQEEEVTAALELGAVSVAFFPFTE